MSEQIKAYWTSFVKFDDPNYLKSASEIDYWFPFDGFETDFNEADSMKFAMVLENRGNYAIGGNFSRHQCDFWNKF